MNVFTLASKGVSVASGESTPHTPHARVDSPAGSKAGNDDAATSKRCAVGAAGPERTEGAGLRRSGSLDSMQALVSTLKRTFSPSSSSPPQIRTPQRQGPRADASDSTERQGALSEEEERDLMLRLQKIEGNLRRPSDAAADGTLQGSWDQSQLSPRPHEPPSGFRAWYLLGLGNDKKAKSSARRGSAPQMGESGSLQASHKV
eukprot:CAMPEP_0114146806 /NCGR_PEP_ID=MMETSP0043_2-20121206/20761_1 /TAXON_ID=464988 /ORGANISM="Hemiselmis andersenii, Strain CCMP644" /LENGTH=202 /DNA_ID=CAMNT_0001241285 /DNA_START=136 /DNA_END=741 /DNA_ORIENTATION=+